MEYMGGLLVQPPIAACSLFSSIPDIQEWVKTPRVLLSGTVLSIKSVRCGHYPSRLRPTAAGVANNHQEQGASIGEHKKVPEIKTRLYQATQGINRGIFGVPSATKSEIESLVELLESQNPTPHPTRNLDKVGGSWKLIYSTITILGYKRTKLGLRDFITLGSFFQNIDIHKGKAVNVIEFNARGLKMLNGQLTVEASFKIASDSRVDIKYENSNIIPNQLMEVFRKNYNLLLSLFNPDGWLEISYVDDEIRIGRDDKGNIFLLERSEHDT